MPPPTERTDTEAGRTICVFITIPMDIRDELVRIARKTNTDFNTIVIRALARGITDD